MRKVLFIVIAFIATQALAEPTTAPSVPSQSVGGILDAKDAGTITGIVLFKGDKPEIKPITDIAGSAYCSQHHKDKMPMRDTFVFGKNGDRDTLENVLVYVSKGLDNKDFDPPKNAVILDQVGCMYTPHVVAVMVGQTLTVRNSDDTLHNVMANPEQNTPFNFAMPVKDGTNDLTFAAPEMKINIKCFMHPWMSGYIHVLANPFFAMTGEDGTFTLKGLPPGTYEISVLHESSAMQPTPTSASVTVGANESKQVEFTYHMKK
jgi:plastocyanin